MTWRAMDSLLVLRDQANEAAPYRSRASDGLVGDPAHQATNSDHNPHFVAGVGSEIVTALDLTHDPAHGFDSYKFAEALRRNRDRRIKYVISNRRIFSSYAVGSRPAWTWGSYGGVDPHTGHVHASVLDAVVSDTNVRWDLEGFIAMADSPTTYYTGTYVESGVIGLEDPVAIKANAATNPDATASTKPNLLAKKLNKIDSQGSATAANVSTLLQAVGRMEAALKRIEDKVDALAATPPGTVVLPDMVTFSPSAVVWDHS